MYGKARCVLAGRLASVRGRGPVAELCVDYRLTASELEQFNADGYAGPFDLYEPSEMERHRRSITPKLLNPKTAIYKDEGSAVTTSLSNYDRHLDIDFLAEHITRPEIVDRVSSILGPDVLCWRSEFIVKYPGDEGTDWHQADTFSAVTDSRQPQILWPEGAGAGTITVWCAFTDSTVEKGCMQFIPGTHKKPMNYDESKTLKYDPDSINSLEKAGVKRGFFGYDYRQLQRDPNWSPDESEAVDMVMRKGQFVIFWSTMLHASHPHLGLTKEMRLGYVARYVPACVRVYPDRQMLDEFHGYASLENYGCVLVSGQDRYGHNKIAKTTFGGTPFRRR